MGFEPNFVNLHVINIVIQMKRDKKCQYNQICSVVLTKNRNYEIR